MIVFGTAWISLIAVAHITLGAHWPSDIIVGFIMGALWLATVMLSLEACRFHKE